MNVDEVVQYWVDLAQDDWPVVEHLFASGDYKYAVLVNGFEGTEDTFEKVSEVRLASDDASRDIRPRVKFEVPKYGNLGGEEFIQTGMTEKLTLSRVATTPLEALILPKGSTGSCRSNFFRKFNRVSNW